MWRQLGVCRSGWQIFHWVTSGAFQQMDSQWIFMQINFAKFFTSKKIFLVISILATSFLMSLQRDWMLVGLSTLLTVPPQIFVDNFNVSFHFRGVSHDFVAIGAFDSFLFLATSICIDMIPEKYIFYDWLLFYSCILLTLMLNCW